MIRSRLVNARATRTALIAASVPELTKRTRSIDGISSRTRSPSWCSSGLGAPKLVPLRGGRGDRLDLPARRVAVDHRSPRHDVVDEARCRRRRSTVAPDARLMKSGAPPTDLKARTGLSTPPGRIALARAKSFWEVTGFFMVRRIQNSNAEFEHPLEIRILILHSALEARAASRA